MNLETKQEMQILEKTNKNITERKKVWQHNQLQLQKGSLHIVS